MQRADDQSSRSASTETGSVSSDDSDVHEIVAPLFSELKNVLPAWLTPSALQSYWAATPAPSAPTSTNGGAAAAWTLNSWLPSATPGTAFPGGSTEDMVQQYTNWTLQLAQKVRASVPMPLCQLASPH